MGSLYSSPVAAVNRSVSACPADHAPPMAASVSSSSSGSTGQGSLSASIVSVLSESVLSFRLRFRRDRQSSTRAVPASIARATAPRGRGSASPWLTASVDAAAMVGDSCPAMATWVPAMKQLGCRPILRSLRTKIISVTISATKRARWAVSGEAPNQYFLGLLKRRTANLPGFAMLAPVFAFQGASTRLRKTCASTPKTLHTRANYCLMLWQSFRMCARWPSERRFS